MSTATIHKRHKKTLEKTQGLPWEEYYDFYDVNGDSTVAVSYVYVPNIEPGMCLVYESSATQEPTADSSLEPLLLTGKFTRLDSSRDMRSAVISKITDANPDYDHINDKRDASIYFEIFSSSTLSTFSKLNSLIVKRNFPNSKTYQLMNGGITKYMPSIKHNIAMSLSYLTSDELEEILNFFQDPVLIIPEKDSGSSPFDVVTDSSTAVEQIGAASKTDNLITIISPSDSELQDNTNNKALYSSFSGSKYFHWMDGTIDKVKQPTSHAIYTILEVEETITGDIGNKNTSGFKSGGLLSPLRNFDNQGYFYCNLVGDSVDFQYTTSMKDTGYSGSLSFQEI